MDLEAKPPFIKAEICRQEPSAIGEVTYRLSIIGDHIEAYDRAHRSMPI
jgi:hypothetical protein